MNKARKEWEERKQREQGASPAPASAISESRPAAAAEEQTRQTKARSEWEQMKKERGIVAKTTEAPTAAPAATAPITATTGRSPMQQAARARGARAVTAEAAAQGTGTRAPEEPKRSAAQQRREAGLIRTDRQAQADKARTKPQKASAGPDLAPEEQIRQEAVKAARDEVKAAFRAMENYDYSAGERDPLEQAAAEKRYQEAQRRLAELTGSTASTRVGAGLESVVQNLVWSPAYLLETVKKTGENRDRFNETDYAERAEAALMAMKNAAFVYGEDSEEYRKAKEANDALREEIAAWRGEHYAPVDPESAASRGLEQGRRMQETALEGLSPTARFLGSTALSIANNAANMAATGGNPAATLLMMGAEAAAGKAYDKQQEGMAADEALLRGIAAGGTEALTESVSLGSFLEMVKTGGKGVLTNLLKQSGVEGLEESTSYLLELAYEAYADNPGQSLKQWIDTVKANFSAAELAEQTASGALSGLVMGGAGTAINAAAEASEQRTLQRETDQIFREALREMGMDPDGGAGADAAEMQREAPIAAEAQQKMPTARTESTAEALIRRGTVTPEELVRVSMSAPKGQDAFAAEISAMLDSGRIYVDEEGNLHRTENGLQQAAEELAAQADEEALRRSAAQEEARRAAVAARTDAMIQQGEALGNNGKKAFRYALQQDRSTFDRDQLGYYEGFMALYNAGLEGRGRDSVDAAKANALTPAQALAAWDSGRQDAKASLKTERQKGAVIAKEAGLMDIEAARTLDGETRDRLEKHGRALGLSIVVDDALAATGGEESALGYLRNGELHLSAKADGQTVVRHEITHRLQELAPKEYRAFRDMVMALQEDGTQAILDKQRQYSELTEGRVVLSNEEAMDELAADYAGKLLTDERAIARVMEENRTLGQRIREILRKIGEELRKIFGKSEPTLERAQALWDRAYEQAARNAENGQKNTAREGAGRYALDNIQKRIGAAMSDSERSAILKKRTFVPAEYAGQAEARVEAERDNLESGKKKLVKEALRRAADEFGALGMMNNADMELEVIVSHGSINESGQKQNGHEAELMRLMPVLREAVKGAVGIEIHDNRYFADNQTVRFVNLLGGYTTGNSFIPVRFGIKVQRNGRNTLYVMIAEDQIKKAEVVRTQVPKKSVYYAPRSAEINIAELAKKVKSASLLKYFPDGLLNQEQRIAKWKAVAETVAYTNSKNDERYKKYIKSGDKQNAGRMVQAAAEAAGYTIRAYHGTTNAEQKRTWNTKTNTWDTAYKPFTVFKQQYEGQAGHFFASDPDNAREYGSTLYPVFLRLEKPLVIDCAGQSYDAITFRGETWDTYDLAAYAKKNHYDGVIFQNIRDGADIDSMKETLEEYVVFDSNRIKSAETITYDNDGNVVPLSKRFDSGKRDIRYDLTDEEARKATEWEQAQMDKSREVLDDPESTESDRMVAELVMQRTEERIGERTQRESRNARLEELNRHLQAQLRESRVLADRKAIDRMAREITKEYASEASRPAVAQKLQELYDAIGNKADEDGRALSWDQVYDRAEDVARTIIRTATEQSNPLYEEYKDLRDYLRETRLTISPEDAANIVDFQDFRKHYFGRIRIGTGQTNVDVLYQEMAERWPGFFGGEEHTHPADQLEHIAQVADALQPVMENPYGMDTREAREAESMLAGQLIERFYDLPQTGAAEAKRELAETSRKYRRAREKAAAWREQVRQESRESIMREVSRLRDEKNAEIQAILEHQREVRAKQARRNAVGMERRKLLNVAKRLNNPHLKTTEANKAMIRELIGDLDTVAVKMTGKKLNDLQALQEWYMDEARENENFIADPGIEKALARLKKKQIADMSIEDVRALTDVLLNIDNEIRTQNKLIDAEDRRDTYDQGMEIIRHLHESGGSKGGAVDWAVTNTLSPVRQIKRMVGYAKGDPLIRAAESLADGQRKMMDYQMRAQRDFQKFAEDKDFQRRFAGKDAKRIKIRGATLDGTSVEAEITPAMRVSIYLHSLNDENMRHMQEGGITVPDAELYRKGKIEEAYARGTTLLLDKTAARAIAEKMSEKERSFAQAAYHYYQSQSKAEINATSEKLKGYALAQEDNYYPINTNTNFTRSEYESLKRDGTLEGMGFLKERVHSKLPMMLRDANDVVEQSIRQHSKYVGLAIPVRNMSKLLNVSKMLMDPETGVNAASDSVKAAIEAEWGKRGAGFVEKMMTDLQNGGKSSEELTRAMGRLRGNYAQAVLTLNASVAMKQAASYPTAAAVLGWRPLIRAMGDVGKVDLDLIAKYTPLQWYRSQGFSTKELGDLKNANRSLPPLLNWVQGVDVLTTRKLWKASEYYVRQEQKNLKPRSDAYYKAVAEIYNRVIEETQPNYTTMQRPQLLRSDDTLVGSIMMFKTQPFQNTGILYDAAAEYRAAKRRGDRAEIRETGKNLRNAVSSQIVQLATFAGMTAAWALFRGKADKYEDEEKEQITVESFLKALGKDMAGGALAGIPFGSDAWELLSSKVFGDKYYGMDSVTVTALSDTVSAVTGLVELVSDMTKSVIAGEEIGWNGARLKLDGYLDKLSKGLGWPYENVANLFTAAYRNTCIGIRGKYEGEYIAMKLTTDPEKYSKDYFDFLYKAKKNDKAAYQKILADMTKDDTFATETLTPDERIAAAMENRRKKDKTVVEEADRVYAGYMEKAKSSGFWGGSSSDAKNRIDDIAQDLSIGNADGKKLQEKLDRYGLEGTDWILYQLALDKYDEPNKSGKLGSYTAAEKQAAIDATPGLTDRERAALWLMAGGSEKNNPYD